MIYRTDGGQIYNPLDWKLYTIERKRILLDSEEALREYLKSHPDEDFFLIPGIFFNREIQGREASSFDPRQHIRCGVVRYDSASGRVVTRDTMKVTYSDSAKQRKEDLSLLQQATARLEEVPGPSAAWLLAFWDRTADARGRPVYTLRLSDWEGSVSATFTRDELHADAHDRYRWHRIWGDLLQERSRQQLLELTTGSMLVGA